MLVSGARRREDSCTNAPTRPRVLSPRPLMAVPVNTSTSTMCSFPRSFGLVVLDSPAASAFARISLSFPVPCIRGCLSIAAFLAWKNGGATIEGSPTRPWTTHPSGSRPSDRGRCNPRFRTRRGTPRKGRQIPAAATSRRSESPNRSHYAVGSLEQGDFGVRPRGESELSLPPAAVRDRVSPESCLQHSRSSRSTQRESFPHCRPSIVAAPRLHPICPA